jgi:NitT/TauT family transport system permease protein
VTEYVQFGQEPTSTFGLGAEIAKAAKAANFPVLLAGTLLLVAVVILINRVLWKRMYGLAERRYTLG